MNWEKRLSKESTVCLFINERQENSVGNSYYCFFLDFLLLIYFVFSGFVLQGMRIHYPAMKEPELLYYSCSKNQIQFSVICCSIIHKFIISTDHCEFSQRSIGRKVLW